MLRFMTGEEKGREGDEIVGSSNIRSFQYGAFDGTTDAASTLYRPAGAMQSDAEVILRVMLALCNPPYGMALWHCVRIVWVIISTTSRPSTAN